MNPTQQTFEAPESRPAAESRGAESRVEPVGGRQVEVARVVLVDENQLRASTLTAALKATAQDLAILSGPDGWALRDQLFTADLVLLALGGRQVSALATGAEAVQRNPYAEVVFYCDDAETPEVAAAAVLVITRIVPSQQMAPWLSRAGALLARAACLRRTAAAMLAAVPAPPALAVDEAATASLPLPTAEMRFRESYIRCLLTQTGSRQEAARRAGVPYRTMCEMIRKLGIAAD